MKRKYNEYCSMVFLVFFCSTRHILNPVPNARLARRAVPRGGEYLFYILYQINTIFSPQRKYRTQKTLLSYFRAPYQFGLLISYQRLIDKITAYLWT